MVLASSHSLRHSPLHLSPLQRYSWDVFGPSDADLRTLYPLNLCPSPLSLSSVPAVGGRTRGILHYELCGRLEGSRKVPHPHHLTTTSLGLGDLALTGEERLPLAVGEGPVSSSHAPKAPTLSRLPDRVLGLIFLSEEGSGVRPCQHQGQLPTVFR